MEEDGEPILPIRPIGKIKCRYCGGKNVIKVLNGGEWCELEQSGIEVTCNDCNEDNIKTSWFEIFYHR